MKRLPIFLSILVAGGLFTGCKKEFQPVATFKTEDPTAAKLKVNFTSVYRNNPNVQIKINNERVSNLLTARTPFPGGGYNTNGDSRPDYLSLTPGQTAVSISIPKASTNTDSVKLFDASFTLQSSKSYTLHTADTAANTKHVLVEDDVSAAAAGSSKYRFINLMPNVPAIDLYYGTTLMAANVPYLSITNTFTMPTPSASQAWTIREAGTSPTSTALATYTSGNTTLSTRTYTAFAMGYKGITATSDARRPFISFFLNR